MHYNISTVGLCAAKVAVRNTVRLLSYTKGGKHLGVVDVYTKIPYDLSGSISKNRFRQELCWGISKMFDLFDKEDFCVVFDYKCDIEIVEAECKSLELQTKQQTLFEYMDTISTDVSFEEMAETLLSRYSTTFPIEYSQTDRYVFATAYRKMKRSLGR